MKTENEMTDEELDRLEEDTKIIEDRYDRLELLRKSLNSSRIEQMYVIKRSQALGPLCPYYKKSVKLFEQNEKTQIIQQLQSLLAEFSNE